MIVFSSVHHSLLSLSKVCGRTKQSSIPHAWECLLFGTLSEGVSQASVGSKVLEAIFP